jgi:hypothetical protein
LCSLDVSILLFLASPNQQNDIDLLVDLEPSCSLLDQIGFQQELEDLLGIPVDVVETTTLHEMIRDQVLRDAVSL